jgi:hypothetical protein
MLPRILNGDILAAQHRVVFSGEPVSASKEEDVKMTETGADDTTNEGAVGMKGGDAECVHFRDRYSTPFELFLAPRYEIDCARLLAHSSRHFTHKGALLPACTVVETAQIASCAFSQGLVSVNKSN